MEAFHYVDDDKKDDKKDIPVMPGPVMPKPVMPYPVMPKPQFKPADKKADWKRYVLWLILIIAIIALVYGGVCAYKSYSTSSDVASKFYYF
jgi:hypothetical protein